MSSARVGVIRHRQLPDAAEALEGLRTNDPPLDLVQDDESMDCIPDFLAAHPPAQSNIRSILVYQYDTDPHGEGGTLSLQDIKGTGVRPWVSGPVTDRGLGEAE